MQQSGFSGFSMVAGTGFDPPPPRARTVAALRCFFRFYVESDYLERDPSARAAHAEEARGAARRVLDRAELSRLLDVPGREGDWQRVHVGKVERYRLLLALFSYGGLRRAEPLGLDLDDVDLDRLCATRKGGHGRVVPCRCSMPCSLCVRRAASRRCSWASTAG